MAVHGPFKNKNNAKEFAKKQRKKGFSAVPYKKTNLKWYVSVFRLHDR